MREWREERESEKMLKVVCVRWRAVACRSAIFMAHNSVCRTEELSEMREKCVLLGRVKADPALPSGMTEPSVKMGRELG